MITERVTAEWPVQDRTRTVFERAAMSHYISPLPAFDEDHSLIDPNEYHKKLCGAVVQVHFALIHYFIKQDKKSVFTAVVREIIVLHAPPAAPMNPLKHGRLSDGPSMSCGNVTKKIRNVGLLTSSPDWSLIIISSCNICPC